MPNSNDDDELWALVTKDVKPIKGRRQGKKAACAVAVKPKRNKVTKQIQQDGYRTSPQKEKRLRSSSVDRRTDERLRRGQMKIDGTLDLHGLNQIQAYEALLAFVMKKHKQDARCLLVITGKGGLAEKAGVLRQKLPLWLAAPPLADDVLRIYPARPRHGGTGAFYVLLRRRR